MTLSSHIKGRVSTDRSTSWLTFPKRGRESKTHDSQVQWCEDLQSQRLGRLRKEDDGAQEFKTSLGNAARPRLRTTQHHLELGTMSHTCNPRYL